MQHTDPTALDEIIPPSVLLVDDHPANLVALEAVLETLGARRVRAQWGEAALAALAQEECAVVLIDACMPGLDGFETVARIKRQPSLRSVPIIFITALDRDARRVAEAYAQGAADFLFKPIEPAILRAKVAVFVELFRKKQEIARLDRDLERRVEARTRAWPSSSRRCPTSWPTRSTRATRARPWCCVRMPSRAAERTASRSSSRTREQGSRPRTCRGSSSRSSRRSRWGRARALV